MNMKLKSLGNPSIKTINLIINEAKTECLHINNAATYQIFYDKWSSITIVFYVIYSKINGLDKQKINDLMFPIQEFLDKGISSREELYSTIENLAKLNIIHAVKPKQDANVVYSTRGSLFVDGKIWIEINNIEQFKIIRIKFTDLMNLIEKRGKKIFLPKKSSRSINNSGNNSSNYHDRIKNITIVYSNKRNKPKIVINKNYIESFEIIESTSKYIISLMNAITNSTDILKDTENPIACRDYLNSNSSCRLYKNKAHKQIYTITTIVELKDNFASNKKLTISPKIKTYSISHTKYASLLSNQMSKNKAKAT